MKKINEIFYSLQGEGFWSGTPIIFIRFSGCNLRCDFCDTEHYSHTEMSDAEIIDRIKTFPARRVCLTGGEPSLQIDRFFIDLLHSHGYIIHIETNGTHAIPDGIDWITVSPKTSRIALDRADELKIVFTGQDVDSWLHFDANHRYLQPCSCRNTPEVIQYILAHPEWSLSLQTLNTSIFLKNLRFAIAGKFFRLPNIKLYVAKTENVYAADSHDTRCHIIQSHYGPQRKTPTPYASAHLRHVIGSLLPHFFTGTAHRASAYMAHHHTDNRKFGRIRSTIVVRSAYRRRDIDMYFGSDGNGSGRHHIHVRRQSYYIGDI